MFHVWWEDILCGIALGLLTYRVFRIDLLLAALGVSPVFSGCDTILLWRECQEVTRPGVVRVSPIVG